jgi:hypothetical protein|mmetsp:Transcript_18278/g.33130  ORF Transcript_18278/g.33130 Transcript_18278/m.33130 type:complete len:312 (-) Transcript_18278:585-1520(-)
MEEGMHVLREDACRICGKSAEEDPRALCHFDPISNEAAAVTETCLQDICVHVFCGKTASILPSVNMPQYEILSKAGIKNKHGIGPDVNGALARSRYASVPGTGNVNQGKPDKTFYLVKEFEAHLANIRGVRSGAAAAAAAAAGSLSMDSHGASAMAASQMAHANAMAHAAAAAAAAAAAPYQISNTSNSPKKAPARASAGKARKSGQGGHHMTTTQELPLHMSVSVPVPLSSSTEGWTFVDGIDPSLESHLAGMGGEVPLPTVQTTEEGKIQCDCGGTYWPLLTARGEASWKTHMGTNIHQSWMQEHLHIG